MKFVDAPQRSPEWYKARLGKVTASEFKNVIAYGAKGQPLKARTDYKRQLVTERLIGWQADPGIYVTPEMQWGMMNEDTARQIYTLRTGLRTQQEGICLHDELAAGASVDGLVTDGITNLEIKCLTSRNHLYEIVKLNSLPDAYRDQVQFQLWITERERCHFIGYDSRLPVGLDLFILEVPRDEEYIQYIEQETREFLAEVDKDVWYFMRYLPTAERVCRSDGTIFTDKLALCPECGMNNTQITKVLQEAEIKLVEKGHIRVLDLED